MGLKALLPLAAAGAVACVVLVDMSDDTAVVCVTCGNVPVCDDHSMEG